MIRLSSRRYLVRGLAVAATGALALVGVVIGATNGGAATGTAASDTDSCVTGGTGTILMNKSYIHHMLSHHISITPLDWSSTSATNSYTITNYSATGGDADLSASTGVVQYNGGVLVMNTITGHKLVLLDIKYDLVNSQIVYSVVTLGGIQIPAFDLAGDEQRTIDGNTRTYSASKLLVSATAASAMDSYFGTNVFQAGDVMGPGFRTTYTVGPCA
jgi:hypothetical protein